MREREVRYITNEARTEFFIVRPEWRGFAYGALADEIATEIGCTVLASDTLPTGDPSGLPPPPGPERRQALAVPHVRIDVRPQGRVARRRVGHRRACTRSSPGSSRPPDDVYPICFPVSHIGGANMLAAALHVGYRLPLVEAFDAEQTPLFMAEQGATLLGTALPMFQAYLAAQRRHGDEPLFPRLADVRRRRRAQAAAGIDEVIRRELGGLGVVSSWGLTEFPTATSASVDDTLEQIETTEGRASPGVEIRVVGLDGNECGPGEEGELRLRGPQPLPGLRQPRARRRRARRAGLLPHRRPRHRRRHRPRHDHRAAEGHHHPQRREHLGRRDRGAPPPAPGHRRRRGHRSPRPAHRRARVRGGRAGRRRDVALARRARRALPRARPRQAEGARAARDRRRGPPQRDGQDPETRAPQAVRPA